VSRRSTAFIRSRFRGTVSAADPDARFGSTLAASPLEAPDALFHGYPRKALQILDMVTGWVIQIRLRGAELRQEGGLAARAPAMANGRCRMHEGLYSAAAKASDSRLVN
jgi:hypothetical protein